MRNKASQKKMLKDKKGGSDFGSGPREERPSPLIDRARRRLLKDIGQEDELEDSPLRGYKEPIGVLESLIDPNTSPFAQNMTSSETEELRKQLPGSRGKVKVTSSSESEATKKRSDTIGGSGTTALELEMNAVKNANRNARLTALAMLNE